MDCKTVGELRNRQDRLTRFEREAFERHFSECVACHTECADTYIDVIVRETVLADHFDTTAFERGVRSKMRRAERPPWFRSLQWQVAPLLALALLLLFLLLRPRAVSPTILSEAIEDHSEEVVHHSPLEWTSDSGRIATLMYSWTGNAALDKRLAPAGFHLDRVRICELMNRTYLHLVYSDGAREVSIFVRKRDGESLTGKERLVRSRSLLTRQSQDISVAAFQSRDLTVVFVGAERDNIPEMTADVAAAF